MAKEQVQNIASTVWEFIAQWVTWDNTKLFANSGFTTALIGSLAGALAGAIAAQRIVERDKARNELLKEIRNTNATLTLAFMICNGALIFKKQLVKPIYDEFHKELERYHLEIGQVKSGALPDNHELHFLADFRNLPPQELPVLDLQKQCYEKLSLNGRGLVLPLTIVQTLGNMNRTVSQRNSLIENFRQAKFPAKELAALYFGLPLERADGSHISEEYKDTVVSIFNQNDDTIFFTWLLCKDLHEHGLNLVKSYKKITRGEAPKINEPSFGAAEADGSIPNEKNYQDWVNWGGKVPAPKT